MKKYLSSLFFLLLLSCNSNTERTDNKKERNQEIVPPVVQKEEFIDSGKFKVSKQDLFSLKEWKWDEREAKLIKMSKDEISKYFQAPLDSESTYNTFYFFSIQENTPTRKSITIIESDESCCSSLHMLTYDGNNKIIGKSKVASSGGDGDWGYDAYGRFDSDSTYYFTHVEEETIRDDADASETEADSIVIRFSVDKNRNFKKLSEKKFEYNKVYVTVKK